MDSTITSAEDAFAVLSSQIRLEILETLGNEIGESYSFTELYDAVDTQNTSQFSYHLTELTDRYVQQTNDGYMITDAGLRIVESIRSGEYTTQPDFEPVTVRTSCPYCSGDSGEAAYDGQLVTIDCQTCEHTLLRYDLRPAHVIDRDSLQSLFAADRQMRAAFSSAIYGVCQRCGGIIEAKLATGEAVDPATALLACECQLCGTELAAPVEIAVLHHPAVISHQWSQDRNVVKSPMWELFSLVSEWDVEVDASGEMATVTTSSQQFEVDTRQGIDIRVARNTADCSS